MDKKGWYRLTFEDNLQKRITCLKYLQNSKLKRLTFKCLLMYFDSMNLLLPFLAYELFKTWNYVVDSNTYIFPCIQAISRFGLTYRDAHLSRKWNENSYSAFSQCLGNITTAEHQYFSTVYSQIAFQQHDSNAVL